MPTWLLILIIAGAVVVIAALAVVVNSRRTTARLKQRYGAEYQRLQSEHGDHRAAEKELTDRERNRDKLDIVALTPSAFTHFTHRWQQAQLAFVDDPTVAVAAADRLITDVMRERGYPVDAFEQRAADISVDHPHIVENYRAAHAIHLAQLDGHVDTEKQREAFVYYRALFESLLETNDDNETSQEATA